MVAELLVFEGEGRVMLSIWAWVVQVGGSIGRGGPGGGGVAGDVRRGVGIRIKSWRYLW